MSASALRCRGFGRSLASDVVVPGAIGYGNADPPEIVIRRMAARQADTDRTVWRDGDTLHFARAGVAEYRCTAQGATKGTIDVAASLGATESDLSDYLIATALPALLWLQGAFVLHAAAVILPGCARALAIAATSGTGKSTMLAHLVARGASVVADDTVCLRAEGTAVMASGLPGGYFARAGDAANRHFVAVAPDRRVEQAPLGPILILSRDADAAPPSFRRLAPFEALTAILAHRHRPAIPALFGDRAQRLADAARIARLPLYAWRRRTGSISLTDAEERTLSQLSRGDDHG